MDFLPKVGFRSIAAEFGRPRKSLNFQALATFSGVRAKLVRFLLHRYIDAGFSETDSSFRPVTFVLSVVSRREAAGGYRGNRFSRNGEAQ